MFKNLPEKAFFRLVMIAAGIGFLGIFVFAVYLERFNVPPAGMKVPFWSTMGKPAVQGGPTPLSPLAVQNMTEREVAMQLDDIIAEALSLNSENFAVTTAAMQKHFTQIGYEQYRQFLDSAGIQSTIATQNLQSGAYVEQNPLELTNGVYDGAYKWLFEVPVTISFIPRNSETYRDDQTKALNRRFLLRAQFTRVKDPADPEAVKIEIWQILPPRPAN